MKIFNLKILNMVKLLNSHKRYIILKYIIISFFLMILNILFVSKVFCHDYKCVTTSKNSEFKKKIKDKLLGDDSRLHLQVSVASPKNLFRIHYDTTGVNAVDNTDVNYNGIPDYIDSVAFYFGFAYDIEVNKLGFVPPLTDSLRGGDNLYDIYVIELIDPSVHDAIYGWTEGEDEIYNHDSSLKKNNSFIYIDNNYSPTDSITYVNQKKGPAYTTTGIAGLKVTSAHEFHHAIQLGYWHPVEGIYEFMEMTSTWIENYVHPEIDDYFQYLPGLFQKINEFPISNVNDPASGYRWSIFLHYLSKNFDVSIIREIWKNFEEKKEVFASINLSLKKYNTVLSKTWCEFVPWLYYTSYRAIDTTYFGEAILYPKLQMIFTEALLKGDTTISKTILPFQVLPYRFNNQSGVTSDIQVIDFLLTSSYDYLNETNSEPAIFKLELSSTDKFKNKVDLSNSITYQFGGSDIKGDFCTSVYINDGLKYSSDSYVMPNPVKINTANVNIVLPLDTPGNEYEVNIFDSKMNNVFYKKNIKTGRYNGVNCIIINNNNESFVSGVYFYSVVFKEQTFFGKFAIIND